MAPGFSPLSYLLWKSVQRGSYLRAFRPGVRTQGVVVPEEFFVGSM